MTTVAVRPTIVIAMGDPTVPINAGHIVVILLGLVAPAGVIGAIFVAWGRRTEQAEAIKKRQDTQAAKLEALEREVASLRSWRAEVMAVERYKIEQRSQYTPPPADLPPPPTVG